MFCLLTYYLYLCIAKQIRIIMRRLMIVLCVLLSLTAQAQHGEYVGGDISMLTAYEKNSSGYLDKDGQKIDDLVRWLTVECGWNTFRVRLFVNPSDTKHEGVIQDLDYVKALGKRIKDAGAKLMLDFHYSDTWVDATHIQAPKAWSDCTTADAKAERLAQYTTDVLTGMKEAGAQPDLVQVGNEIMYGFVGIKVAPYDKADSDWDGYLKVLKAGCDAVRKACPQAKVIVHTDRPANRDYNRYYYGKLVNAGIDFDVIGLSYYPFWHGYLTAAQVAGKTDKNNLSAALTDLASAFPDKKVQIVETAYNFQYWPSSGVNYNTQDAWPCSPDGQYKYVNDLIAELSKHENVDGMMYWFPEEAGNGDYVNWTTKDRLVIDPWLNRGFWWEDATTTGHWPVTSGGKMAAMLFRDFLDPNITGITAIKNATAADGKVYNLNGQRMNAVPRHGIYVTAGKAIAK